MKTCPICHTNSFADISTCYNCMHNFKEATEVNESVEIVGEPQETSGSLLKLYPQADTFEPVNELPIRVGVRAAQDEALVGGNEARLEIVVSLQPSLAETQNSFFDSSLARVDNAREAQRQVIELC